MIRLQVLFQNNDGIGDKMDMKTPAGKKAAYALAKEYIRDNTGRHIHFREFDRTDTSCWIDGSKDPEAMRTLPDAWNREITQRHEAAMAAAGSETCPDSDVYAELAASSCEMANVVIHNCRHIAFFHDEYGCCMMQTRLTARDAQYVHDNPEMFRYLVLEYY